MKYKIIRHFASGDRQTISTGLTLKKAREHCQNRESSSTSCKLAENVARTNKLGPWFDGFEEDEK